MTNQRVNLSVNENAIQKKAREHDIKLHSFLEIKLREYLALMEGNSSYEGTCTPPVNGEGDKRADAAGFEPATSGLEGQRPILARPRAHLAIR